MLVQNSTLGLGRNQGSWALGDTLEFKYVHDNWFPRQSKDKVYILKEQKENYICTNGRLGNGLMYLH